MKNDYRGRWALLLCIGLVGCGSRPPDLAFDKVGNSWIKSIDLLQVPETDFIVSNVGSAYGAFGLIGAALGESAEQAKSNQLDSAIRGQAHVGEALTAALEAELKQRGFEVEVTSQRPPSNAGPNTAPVNEQFDYRAIKTRADAILHVSYVGAGYVSAARLPDYEPWLYVRVRLLSGGGKAPLFSQFDEYGAKLAGTKPHVAAQPQYSYPNFDALMANHVAATTGLQEGARLIATAIAEQLR